MNQYRMDDITLGMEASFSKTITHEMMERFCELTGDVNPLHRDGEFAKEHGFKDRVVYGMLSSALISTLAGVYLPGKYCLIQGVDVKMKRPVYVGDTLTVKGVVKEIHESVNCIETKITIVNQDGAIVSKGMLKTGFVKNE